MSYKAALDHLPEELAGNFRGKNLMIIYPDQYGEAANVMTYAAPQMHEERSAYTALREWLGRKMKRQGQARRIRQGHRYDRHKRHKEKASARSRCSKASTCT